MRAQQGTRPSHHDETSRTPQLALRRCRAPRIRKDISEDTVVPKFPRAGSGFCSFRRIRNTRTTSPFTSPITGRPTTQVNSVKNVPHYEWLGDPTKIIPLSQQQRPALWQGSPGASWRRRLVCPTRRCTRPRRGASERPPGGRQCGNSCSNCQRPAYERSCRTMAGRSLHPQERGRAAHVKENQKPWPPSKKQRL